MKPGMARMLMTVVAVVGLVYGLLSFGSVNQYEANLGIGLFVIGGVAAVLRLALIARK